MSELKRFDIVAKYSDEETMYVFGPDGECYDADEVDKVIAELEEKYKMEVEQLLIEIAELKKQVHEYAQGLYVIQARAEKEARHDKYKRCLAMYRYCAIKALYELDCKGNDVEWKWYSKWMHKWYKLAEKFKEAK